MRPNFLLLEGNAEIRKPLSAIYQLSKYYVQISRKPKSESVRKRSKITWKYYCTRIRMLSWMSGLMGDDRIRNEYEKKIFLLTKNLGQININLGADKRLIFRFDFPIQDMMVLKLQIAINLQWIIDTNAKSDLLQYSWKIKDAFLLASGYPGIVGAIYGCYIQIKQPRGDKHYKYINRKKDYAVIIQGVCTMLLDVHIGEVGSMHDARVFCRSELTNSLPRLLDPDEYIVGDSAYPVSPYMMVPYKDNGVLTAKQKSHNNKLSKGRVKIENTWAQLKGKWKRLKY
ncbi:protein ALP1-like [Aphis craccivora]|uniref:Protein ALP1-like n=1 Tax=Aphis craccivora TaxID=307492 RepID=A0A6G0Y0N1_APHCR|nr:protein ALP1-like [Aphis craccivora]